jgi:hypothetical protein
MKTGRRQVLVGGAAAAMTIASTGCGFILYPERRGRTHGRVDALVLVIDLLWLLPGIIPGVICLAVDFTTGCIYESGREHGSVPDARAPHAAVVHVDLDGQTAATSDVGSDRRAVLHWHARTDPTTLREKGRLIIRTPDGARAEARIADLI